MKPIVDILVLLGAFTIFVAALGVVRFPHFLARIHPATKASAGGLVLFAAAAGLHFGSAGTGLKLLFAIAVLFATLPVASQLLAAAYLARAKDSSAERSGRG